MKFYEKEDPIERKIMLLKAVCGSTLIEGMEKAAEKCRDEILKLKLFNAMSQPLKPAEKKALLKKFRSVFAEPIPDNPYAGKSDDELMEIAIQMINEVRSEKRAKSK